MKNCKGYSLIVLVITIAVILIIASTAINTLTSSKEERDISRFIYDVTSLEDICRSYYAEKGILPLGNSINSAEFSLALTNQLEALDDNNYYYINLNVLEKLNLNDFNRGYIINEKTLNIYCMNPVTYQSTQYHTVNNNLMGITGEYEGGAISLEVTGVPINWVTNANLKLVVTPNESASSYTYKVASGKKDVSYFQSSGTAYTYNSDYNVTENGTYTFYADTGTEELVKMVIVEKIDDIAPYVTFNSSKNRVIYGDDETGIDAITIQSQSERAAGSSTYHIIDGFASDIINYNTEKANLISSWQTLTPVEKEAQQATYQASMANLNSTFGYFASSSSNKYIIFVTDKKGNSVYCYHSSVAAENTWEIGMGALRTTFGFETPNYEDYQFTI